MNKLLKFFVHSKLTPVIVVVSLLLGILAVYLTPKEEEPQISVPMIDIQTAAPGFSAKEVERKVTEVIERAVWGLEGVEYVYSSSQLNNSLVTIRFKVGEAVEPSLVKVHHKLMELRSELPRTVLPSEVKSYSVDDVPFLVLTFSSSVQTDFQLRTQVASLARELSSTPEVAKVQILGGQKRVIRIVADPKKMSMQGVSLLALSQSIAANDALAPAGKNWSATQVFDVEVGGRLRNADDIKDSAVGQRGGAIVRVKDVADVLDGPEEMVRSSVLIEKGKPPETAVSIAFAKRKGANVVILANQLIERAKVFGKSLPADVHMSVVRNYGATAAEKSDDLIEHLLIAALSVSILIALFMGIRAALIVAIAIPVTLALTLVIYYFLGYTLNRVTLFALVFSIGILVDDAIVVVENIERHLKMGGVQVLQATINAVAEVGKPTILATFTVIAAILPMAFVRGLMGPYMKPIPVGASFAMMISLLVAFIVTPWAAVKFFKTPPVVSEHQREGVLDRLYRFLMSRLLSRKLAMILFTLMTSVLFILACSLVYFKWVKVKMLPFDNKLEFQVLIDYPATTSLQANRMWSNELAQQLIKNANVQAVQVFSGESSPFSFSGMVKHSYLRQADYLSDLHVVLKPKQQRPVTSHEIITQLRPMIAKFGEQKQALTKVLEIPPGPPVLATMLAEVYGPDEATREETARELQTLFAKEPSVVDLDTSLRLGRPQLIYGYNQRSGGVLGMNAAAAMKVGQLLFSESMLTTLSDVTAPEDIDVILAVAQAARSGKNPFRSLTVPTFETGVTEVAAVIDPPRVVDHTVLHRKNLKPVVYVMSELSGAEEAPVYGILKIAPHIKVPLQTAEVPWNTLTPVVKWDGEWFITYEVFRDLGVAFAIVMVLIYILVLGWFRSFAVPLVIMAPIPISLIGILPGHALLGCFFTATSMIGFIAGAGIIVRNSIILVDFIQQELAKGQELQAAVISAGVLRFRPMLLTAAAVMVGSSVMLSDPIFQGLAVSLIFGEIAATSLSRFAVPVLYYWFIGKSRLQGVSE